MSIQSSDDQKIQALAAGVGEAVRLGIVAFQNQSDDVPFADRVGLSVQIAIGFAADRIEQIKD